MRKQIKLYRAPKIGENLLYINNETRACFPVKVVDVPCDRFAIVESLPPILKLDGTGLTIKAPCGTLYEYV